MEVRVWISVVSGVPCLAGNPRIFTMQHYCKLTRNIFKKIFGGSQILTINATKFAGLDEGATPLGPYSATRGFTW